MRRKRCREQTIAQRKRVQMRGMDVQPELIPEKRRQNLLQPAGRPYIAANLRLHLLFNAY
jgi:hypothetical protein